MGWLVGYVIASMVGAFIVVRIFEYLVAGLAGGIVGTAKLGLFVGAWTAITVGSGMHGFTSRIQSLRKGIGPRNMP